MKNINLLPISDEVKARLSEFAKQYRQHRIYIEVKKIERNRVIVWVEQKDSVNGTVLTKKDLESRVREMFEGELPEDLKLTVSAVNYDIRDIGRVDAEWIRTQMERLGLKAKDIVNRTGFDRSTMSLIISGDKRLTKSMQVAMYYFFKYYEMNNFGKK